jgi:hypothetical protein
MIIIAALIALVIIILPPPVTEIKKLDIYEEIDQIVEEAIELEQEYKKY